MRRSEMEVEIGRARNGEVAAVIRLLKWFDEVTQELGYVYAQRDTIQDLTRKNVELSVELDSVRIELGILRDRARSEVLDDE